MLASRLIAGGTFLFRLYGADAARRRAPKFGSARHAGCRVRVKLREPLKCHGSNGTHRMGAGQDANTRASNSDLSQIVKAEEFPPGGMDVLIYRKPQNDRCPHLLGLLRASLGLRNSSASRHLKAPARGSFYGAAPFRQVDEADFYALTHPRFFAPDDWPPPNCGFHNDQLIIMLTKNARQSAAGGRNIEGLLPAPSCAKTPANALEM